MILMESYYQQTKIKSLETSANFAFVMDESFDFHTHLFD